MAKPTYPVTPAIRALRQAQIAFESHLYEYEAQGGTAVSARELQVDEHCVIKTLVIEDENKHPFMILMHGDKQVSTKQLARDLKVKAVHPCTPEIANKHTGYLVGGTSPFGTKHPLTVYMEKTILELPTIYINGGKRGYLVSVSPQDILELLKVSLVEVGI